VSEASNRRKSPELSAREGQAVIDVNRVQHIASGEDQFTVCGVAWVAFDLFWDTRTAIHCKRCIEWSNGVEA
jgi:hypothetical protein